MDYETAEGSQFSLRELWSDDDATPEFQCTLITAFVDGNAYAGRSQQRMEEMDDVEVIQNLEPVEEACVFPLFPEAWSRAPTFDMQVHYLKAPQFTYEDTQPGNTFVADCMLGEARVLERLRKTPHPSIVKYYGCVLKGKRITHLMLQRCYCNLFEYYHIGLPSKERIRLLQEVREGVRHLHTLGLAHNDLNPNNVCVDAKGHAIIVDFDSCAPFGQPLMKGVGQSTVDGQPRSAPENDMRGIDDIEEFLFPPDKRRSVQFPDGRGSSPMPGAHDGRF